MSVDESAPTCHQPPLTCGLVEAEALRLDCALSKDNITRLAGFVGLLSRWSRRIRLTGSADASQIVTRQLADALVLSARLPAGEPAQRCVDVGAGGGLPGMACAAVRPDVQITFVEANARKCAFLRTAAHELGIRCGFGLVPPPASQLRRTNQR
jgi:16S rRNA (guanine527-N7)-methyltransferase